MFNMNLLTTDSLKAGPFCTRVYDEELDDCSSVLADICEMIQNTKQIKFYVSGFGDEEWPVDCRVDLLGVIEQMPEIIKKITDNHFDFTLNFYEQGIERELIFEEWKDDLRVLCKSRTSWKPNPKTIVINKTTITCIFFELYKDFFNIAHVICKNLLLHPLMKEFIIELPV